VEREKIDRIIDAIKLAPSAGNLQAFEVVVVAEPERVKGLYKGYFSKSLHENVQAVLVFLADPAHSAARFGERGATLYSVQDATIACCYAMLAAADLGLASVWVGAFHEDIVAKVVNAGNKRPVALLPLGYAAEEPPRPPRREGVFFGERL
jgi:nitroreductase